jgi:hypothetical protein
MSFPDHVWGVYKDDCKGRQCLRCGEWFDELDDAVGGGRLPDCKGKAESKEVEGPAGGYEVNLDQDEHGKAAAKGRRRVCPTSRTPTAIR